MRGFVFFILINLLAVVSYCQVVNKKSDIIETFKGEKYFMHFVAAGETVQTIAKLYGVTNVEILKANPELAYGIKADMVVKIPLSKMAESLSTDSTRHLVNDNLNKSNNNQKVQQEQSTNIGKHKVQSKETWYSLSRMYRIPVSELIEANADVDTLKIGMEISIPEPKPDHKVITEGYAEHTVEPQETLYSLSKKYSITVEELQRLNPSILEGLKAGQVIIVSAKSNDNADVLKIQYADTSYMIHVVERKETLYGISRLYGLQLDDIIKANPDIDNNLKKGYELKIPKVSMKVRTFTKPDTVIMGRAINQEAVGNVSVDPCTQIMNMDAEYNIALLIPMQLELIDSIQVNNPILLKTAIEYSSLDFIQFYEGALIAVDSLVRAGMNIKMHVYDADYGDNTYKVKKILGRSEFRKMDLIIGPFFAESFKLASDYANQHKVPIVNPLSRRSEMILDNEMVILLQPSLLAQYENLANYIKSKHATDNVILVRRNEEENKSFAIAFIDKLKGSNGNSVFYKEVIYSKSGWTGISKELSITKSNLVIITTSDRAVLPAILRELAERAESHNITIVGMPDWEELELEYNYLTKLNTHFCVPWFVNYFDFETKNFIADFRKRYAGEPELDKYAFLGYDAVMFFASALRIHGKHFMECLEDYRNPGLSNDLHIIKTLGGGYQNASATIFKYTDFTRVKLN